MSKNIGDDPDKNVAQKYIARQIAIDKDIENVFVFQSDDNDNKNDVYGKNVNVVNKIGYQESRGAKIINRFVAKK